MKILVINAGSSSLKYQLIDMDNDDYIDLTDDEKLDVVAARIMKRFKPAFEELAK